MKIGYARTSTKEQNYGLEDQIERLNAEGCEEIFSEQVSSAKEREQLDAAIKFARKGDILVVTKIDRVARSIRGLWDTIEALETKGADIHILDSKLDTSDSVGRMMLNILGTFAQFEREMMLERQKVGIDKAKKEGKFTGRQPTARKQADKIQELYLQGRTIAEIMKELGVSRASVYRYIKKEK